MYSPTARRVAVVNNSDAILETISQFLEESGYFPIPVHGRNFLVQVESLEQFLAEQAPQVIIWDIAPPYDTNWQYFKVVKTLPAMQNRPCIVTTTNLARLQEIMDAPEQVVEIVGKPYDLEQLLDAIKKALCAC